MDKINITKADVIWSYVAQFFNLASGILILPFILHMLPAEEVGLNYLMLTVGSMVALLDFGFAPQFGRNISYIYGGATELKKEGVVESHSGEIDYHLLAVMIQVAKRVYRYLSLIVLAVMLTAGTVYMYYVTDGFSTIHNSFVIWLVYCASTYFNIYFVYYGSLLTGAGLITESKKASIASRICYIVLSIGMLYIYPSLLSVCIANFIAPFVSRYLSYRYYFTNELKERLDTIKVESKEIRDLFSIIWYNAKKLGINFLGAYAINKMGMFLAGLYLTLQEVSSYGLMVQLVTIVGTVSMMLFNTLEPKLSAIKVSGNSKELMRHFAFSMCTFYVLYIIGSIILILCGGFVLHLIGSQSVLPATSIIITYCVVVLLELNHGSFATLIVIGNDVPFVKAAILSGLAIVFCSFLSLQFTTLGIMGLVLAQGLCQLVYNNWKWPKWILDEYNISFFTYLNIGFSEIVNKAKQEIYDRR